MMRNGIPIRNNLCRLVIAQTFVAFGLFLSGCVSMNENHDLANIHYNMGNGHLKNNNYPQALGELLKAEELDSDNPQIQNSLAIVYFKRERPDLAESHVRRALKLQPTYTDARTILAQILTERGRYSEAMTEAQKVIDDLTYPHPELAFENMGIIKFKAGNFEAAKGYFKKSLDYSRENCLAQTYYGRCFYELQSYRRATETLDQAVGYCQRLQYDEPNYYSGLSYFQTGNVEKAESRLSELIKLFPNGKYVEKAKEALETMKR